MRFLLDIVFAPLVKTLLKAVSFTVSKNLIILPVFFSLNTLLIYIYPSTKEGLSTLPFILMFIFCSISALCVYFFYKNNPSAFTSRMFGYPERKSVSEEEVEVQKMWGGRSPVIKFLVFIFFLGIIFGSIMFVFLDAVIIMKIIFDFTKTLI